MPVCKTRYSNAEICKQNECKNPIFESREEMNKYLSRLCYGNLDVIGRLWVEGMKSVLVGSKMCLIPTVHAAAKEEPPKRPPRMKYKDLPLYERPHWEYKQHEEDEFFKCLDKNEKILQTMFKPTIGAWRRDIVKNLTDFATFMKECVCEVSDEFGKQKKCFISCMRCKDNLEARKALVAVSTAAGFILGSRKLGYLYRKLFWASVGGLSTGCLCFPKETDELFRAACYEFDKKFLIVYNFLIIGANKTMPVIGPCDKEKPPEPPKRVIPVKHQCIKVPPPPPPPPKPKPPPPPVDICKEQKRY